MPLNRPPRRSAISWRSRLIVLLLPALLLTGCESWKASRPCPPVAPFPVGLAAEVEKLPQSSPLFTALADYFVLHEQCR